MLNKNKSLWQNKKRKDNYIWTQYKEDKVNKKNHNDLYIFDNKQYISLYNDDVLQSTYINLRVWMKIVIEYAIRCDAHHNIYQIYDISLSHIHKWLIQQKKGSVYKKISWCERNISTS